MTMAQFSRDDMLIYQGREEGRQREKRRPLWNFLRILANFLIH